ncbi:6-phosphofructokinase [Dorcoceras hygrometricum]|uniref:6-phosphofructokinase n=1 Tax=Dorcoceras hygrometricum TaxID=472368 RepID=A0A2Z7DK61_9LAMI|nr:6-phosphofructokinase [Dorcoceras hygrometricum]
MSLFDLQDVCIAIGSIGTLDLPMVVDLIGIYGLKGPYYKLTTTNWFLQALSVIPRGSWGDVARRSYHDPMGKSGISPSLKAAAPSSTKPHARPPLVAAAASLARICSGQLIEENPSVLISSGLLVQADEGVSLPVVDLIDESTAAYREEPVFSRDPDPPRFPTVVSELRLGSFNTIVAILYLNLEFEIDQTKKFFLEIGRRPPPCAAAQHPRTIARERLRVRPLAGRPLPILHAHWLHNIGQHARCYAPPLARGDHRGRVHGCAINSRAMASGRAKGCALIGRRTCRSLHTGRPFDAAGCTMVCAMMRDMRGRALAARIGGGGRRPATISGRLLRRLNFAFRFSSGLSRAAHEVFEPIFDIGPILVNFEILEILGPKLFLAQYDAIKIAKYDFNCKI